MKNNENPVKRPLTDGLSLDELLSKTEGSVFRLVRLATIRALEIHFGSPALIVHPPLDKASTIAFKEIAQGKVALKKKA